MCPFDDDGGATAVADRPSPAPRPHAHDPRAAAGTTPGGVRLRARIGTWRDAASGSDPGLARLISALQVMLAVGVSIGAVYAFMEVTEVLWTPVPAGAPPAAAAALQAQHHGITLLAMLLGGLVAMMSATAVTDATPRSQALTMALMPVPMLATMALSIAVESHHVVGIALLALVMGVGTYMKRFVPRFGPRAFLYGVLLFIGYFFGFLSRGAITEHQLGGLALVLWFAVAVNLVLKLAVVNPVERGRLARLGRAFRARCRGVVAGAADVFAASDPAERDRALRRLRGRMTRLNHTALVIDGSIPDADGSTAAHGLHDELFELEVLVQSVGRDAARLGRADLPAGVRAEVHAWLADLARGGNHRAVDACADLARPHAGGRFAGVEGDAAARLHHLAEAVVACAVALAVWPGRGRRDPAPRPDDAPFASAVTLVVGDLPGSALVSATAAAPGDTRRGRLLQRLRFDPAAQVAVRVMLAVGVAAAIGSVLSERRFYWAVIAVFIVFMGANTSGEQVTKAAHRVAGTVVGILVGSLLAHAVGHSTWSIAVIVGALGVGVYFIKVSYALMTVGVTVMVSQLYEQLGEYSDHLLLLRLEETAIGAVVAVLAALLVFPVTTRRAAAVAARDQVEALGTLLGDAAAHVRDPAATARPTSAARALDHATQQLIATARPLRSAPRVRGRAARNVALFQQSAHRARRLVAELRDAGALDAEARACVAEALDRDRDLVARIGEALEQDAAERPERGDGGDLRLARAERALAAAGAPQEGGGRAVLHEVDLLGETIVELHENVGTRPGRPSGDAAVAVAVAG